MKAFVEEAQEDMIGAIYASDAIKAAFQMRWQQRISMLRGVEKYIESCEFEKKLVLEEINTQRSVPPNYAEDRKDGFADHSIT